MTTDATETLQANKSTMAAVRKRMKRVMPVARVELDFETPWQLLMATILAAQSTDRTINRVTPELFEHYPTAAALAAAEVEDVERIVKPTGFFRNKAKSIMGASRMIAEEFGGEVPEKLEELVRLPGVARKTANVVLGCAYGISSGIVVDTHVGRVARRLGFTTAKDPVKVERDLCALVPRRGWVLVSHQFVLHGRYLCKAKSPDCSACPLAELCPSREAEAEGRWTERADAEQGRIIGG
ncbi:MAG: endonuclease III [Deltaproteobacteria bacterium]|nr:MAG: endonuclease III [Deltaproteobacteria bacterium]